MNAKVHELAARRLANAERKFHAALHTAYRVDLTIGELDQAYEGAGNGLVLVLDAISLALHGRTLDPRDDRTTAIRSLTAELRARGVARVPESEDLVWINAVRNSSAHEGGEYEVISPEGVEEAVALGRALAEAAGRLSLPH